MNESDAAALFDQIAPEIGARERAVHDAEPTLPEPELLDRALRQALARLQREVSQETFVYLKWRVERAKAAARATRAAVATARQVREAARAETPPPSGALGPRTFRMSDGRAWSVHEAAVGPVAWAHGPHCLVFHSDAMIRRVWHYPAGWRELSDDELETLSWQV